MLKYVSKNIITVFWTTSHLFPCWDEFGFCKAFRIIACLEDTALNLCDSAHLPSCHCEHHLFLIDVCLCGATMKDTGSCLFLSQVDAQTKSRGYGDELPFWNMFHGLSRRSWPGNNKTIQDCASLNENVWDMNVLHNSYDPETSMMVKNHKTAPGGSWLISPCSWN